MKGLALTAVAVALAGCQGAPGTTPTTTYGPSPAFSTAPAPALMPPPQPIGERATETKTRSWTDADGTQHTRTTMTSTGASFDPNGAAATLAALLGGGASSGGVPAAANPASYAGTWKLSSGGRECQLTLNAAGAPGGSASTFACFQSDLSRVTSWSLRGYDVVLSGFGQEVATLRVTQPNRMDGRVSGGQSVVAWR